MSSIDDFPRTQTGSSININITCTVVFLVKLFQKYPVYDETKICGKCTTQGVWKALTVNVNLPTNNFVFLQDVISLLFTESASCRYWRNIVDQKLYVGGHIFLEIIPPDYREDCLIHDIIVPLKDIPKQVTEENKKFILRGVVLFVSPRSKVFSALGHYIAYAWRMKIDRWKQFDDLHPQLRAVRNTSLSSS